MKVENSSPYLCYGTNLAGLLVTAVTQLHNPLAEPRAKRTLPRQVIELGELDHTNLLDI
jgi:hypothetical protein